MCQKYIESTIYTCKECCCFFHSEEEIIEHVEECIYFKDKKACQTCKFLHKDIDYCDPDLGPEYVCMEPSQLENQQIWDKVEHFERTNLPCWKEKTE